VGWEHLELGVIGKVVIREIHDRFSRVTCARDLALDDRDDACHRGTAVEGAAFMDKVFDHVDDDESAFHH
jgi:hypothetical protein